MTWKIYFYQTARGEKTVKEFIKKLQAKTIAKVNQNIDLLMIHGPFLGMPYSKRLIKEIYELRIRGKEEVRILYSFSAKNIYLLHAFKKQTRKAPGKEIRTADERRKALDRI